MLHYFALAAWVGAVALLRPVPTAVDWGRALLALAALVLVPCASRWRFHHQRVVLLAGLCFAVGIMLPAGLGAAALVVPWLITATGLAFVAIGERWRAKSSWRTLVDDAGWLFLPVGAGWALLDRLEIRPLGFEPVIVLLTAIHFHYAGFVLPMLAARATQESNAWHWIGPCVALAVPALAAGITATQLGAAPWIESAAALFLVAASGCVGGVHVRLAFASGANRALRVGFLCAGLSLIIGVAFAALYGMRYFLAVAWLDIPTMRAWHGTINSLGFGLIGMLTWDRQSSRIA